MKKVIVKFRKRERGFTLIELLIVIAILGVLAAVVVPNVMGMFSRGGSQAWVTDQDTIRASSASYFADLHEPGGIETNLGGLLTLTGHYWPTYSGALNGTLAAPGLSELDVDGDGVLNDAMEVIELEGPLGPLGNPWTTFAALDDNAAGVAGQLDQTELADTAIIAMPLLENASEDIVGAYMDVPESATDANCVTVDTDLSTPLVVDPDSETGNTLSSTSLQGTHTWFVAEDGKVYSFYVSGGDLIVEDTQTDFSGQWP